jgi:DNA-binding NarL/FixJ family response regulator
MFRVPRFIGGLSRRQLQVVNGVCRGLQNKEIGAELHVSPSTVKSVLTGVYAQLKLSNRYELLMWAMDNGLFKRGQVEREVFGMECVA